MLAKNQPDAMFKLFNKMDSDIRDSSWEYSH